MTISRQIERCSSNREREKWLPEVWGGIECTVNRVENTYFDQIERSGHSHRSTDLDLFAGLGITAIRYPILWERTAPGDLERADWSWADSRLTRLRELGIKPIVGLLHHGSGPRHTSLIDPDFPEKLAKYAGAVARRYPWIESYTPVNEPLTTARFSCLYGHWYPHRSDDRAFARAMINQVKGTALAMRAIRDVNPHARLVQTEDLGKVYSTPSLAYQADFENERRWLTFDLLRGRVVPGHPMWDYLLYAHIRPEELEWFAENPCPPDIMGVNYYLTSERFLDHRLENYPPHMHGGNGRDAYVDVEAVRVLPGGIAGAGTLLREAWDRNGLPIAVTEVHNGCTREQQLLWLMEVWNAASSLKQEGVDIRAVTPWALLGTYDWHTLVTRNEGVYEPGVFDVRGDQPRPTALAQLVRDLAQRGEPSHPALRSESWWHRPSRLSYEAQPTRWKSINASRKSRSKDGKSMDNHPLLITGASGTLGTALARISEHRGLRHRSLRRNELDITNSSQIEGILDKLKPWAVVNAAGYVRVDDSECDSERCYRENTHGPETLAAACASRGIRLLTFSSDLVFDGAKGAPYVESDPTCPLNVYGHSKAQSEKLVLAAHPDALVVRTSAFFGPWDAYNFITLTLQALVEGRPVITSEGEVVSPTYVPDLVNACLDLLIDGESGIWHLANHGAVSWADLARLAAKMAGLNTDRVESETIQYTGRAKRPTFSALTSERGLLLPTLENALSRYLHECTVPWRKPNSAQANIELEMAAS
jgi:dTDP-4-dehydrorhamnose reductase